MTTHRPDDLTDQELEALFRAAIETAPEPGPDLMARVFADAEAELAAASQPAVTAARTARPGLLASLLAALGGWPTLAGLATATVAGVWIGWAAPDGLTNSGFAALLPGAEDAVSYSLEDLLPVGSEFAALLEGS